ncbi:MAG TPA: lasso peptide biosynthesis B2 protein [Xanthobacteraceae bacterium]|nr:lasso peptide biosynthesis B2 protein [Xanthobacteraceae bacterium]
MARFLLIRRLLLRFVQVGNRRRVLAAEAVLCLLAARLALIFVSFPHLSQRIGTLVPPTDPRVVKAGAGASPEQIWIAKEVGWAVTRAARYMPFRAVCLPQAMAAHRMLARRGVASVMHIGAGRGETNPLNAHAWLDAAGVEVTGYPVAERLAEIACFV